MNTETPRPPDVHMSRMLRWVAWTILILMGGIVLVAVSAAFVTAAVDGLDARKVSVLLAIVGVAALVVCLKFAFNPMRHRPNQMNRWREQFPALSEEEIQRFLQVVGGASDLQVSQLSPDDRAADFEPLFGGMELVQILMAVEEAYGLDLPDDFLKTCDNLGQLFDYVSQHRPGLPVTPDLSKPDPAKSR